MYRAERFDRVRDFVDFCEKQPADKSYDWSDPRRCACGQFFESHENDHWLDWFSENERIAADTGIDLNRIAGVESWRFGPLAKRVRAKLETA